MSRSVPAMMQSASSLLIHGVPAMPITSEAIYENGVLKPSQPLPLITGQDSRTQSMITIASVRSPGGATVHSQGCQPLE